MKLSRLFTLILFGAITFAAGPASATNAKWVTCKPTGVAAFGSRIHVRCAQAFSGIVFFAAPVSDTAGAARYLSIATSALTSGRKVRILYDPADTSGANIGCQTGDCRLLQGLEMI